MNVYSTYLFMPKDQPYRFGVHLHHKAKAGSRLRRALLTHPGQCFYHDRLHPSQTLRGKGGQGKGNLCVRKEEPPPQFGRACDFSSSGLHGHRDSVTHPVSSRGLLRRRNIVIHWHRTRDIATVCHIGLFDEALLELIRCRCTSDATRVNAGKKSQG